MITDASGRSTATSPTWDSSNTLLPLAVLKLWYISARFF